MQILKNPEARYTPEDVKKSLEISREIEKLEAELPAILERRRELGAKVAEAKDRLDYAIKSRAAVAEIQEARNAHQLAEWEQDREHNAHRSRIHDLQSTQEKLSAALRMDAHARWLDEMKGLANLRIIEEVKSTRDILTGIVREDIRTNAPILEEAKERLLTAIHQLGGLHYADILTIEEFIQSFESELAKLDLTRLERWNDIPQMHVNDLREKPTDGMMEKGTVMPDGSVHIHPQPTDPRVKALGDRITKLEKGLTQ